MRNFIIIVGVFLGVCLLAVVGMGVFLMLSPGSKLFGIQYVKADSTSSANITKTYDEELTGNIIIETYGVPVNVKYSSAGNFEFHFVQKFNGFTKSNLSKPKLSISKNDDGDLIVKTEEFVPFIWGSSRSGYSLDCTIPASLGKRAITLSSSNSDCKLGSSQYAVGNISTASIKTSGSISFDGSLNIDDLQIKDAKKSINIPSSVVVSNVDISAGGKATKINSVVAGYLKFKSGNGSLTFKTCGALDATTKGGKIESTSMDVSVGGNAKITTTSGKVILQRVNGDLAISANRGNVYVGQNDKATNPGVVGKVTIETTSGKVYLFGTYEATDKAVSVKTSSGAVYVGDNSRSETEKADGALVDIAILNVATKSGKVVIEKVGKTTIETTSGNVEIGSFKEAKINTNSGDVNVSANYAFSQLEVSTGRNGNIKAYGLTGRTIISSQAKIYASFDAVQGAIKIAGKDKEVKVVLPDSITTESKHFWIDSKKTIATVHVGAVSRQAKTYHSIDQLDESDLNLIKVSSSGGKIIVANKKFA